MLKPHQKKSLFFKIQNSRSLDLSEMGTGKTVTALALIAYEKKPALILCPAYLRDNWLAETEKFFPGRFRAAVIRRMADLITHPNLDVLIASYEALPFLKGEFARRPTVIVDEAHYLCNLKANRTRYFQSYNFTFKPKNLVLMTGTPIRNCIPDLYSLIAAVRPEGFLEEYPKFWDFARTFSNEIVKKIGSIRKTEYVGVRQPERLKSLLAGVSVRYRLTDIEALPDFTRETVTFSPDEEISEAKERALWAEFELNEKGELKSIENDATAKAFNALVKAEYTIKWVTDFFIKQPDEPLVIVSDHPAAAEKIAAAFGAPVITGSTPSDKRNELVTAFQAGAHRLIVGTIGAMGTGFTLHRARYLVFNDLSWVPAKNLQAEKRIHRIGQARPCIIYSFYISKIDARIGDRLEKKARAINQVLS